MTKLKKNKDEDNEVVELAFEAGVCETTKTGYTSCPLHFWYRGGGTVQVWAQAGRDDLSFSGMWGGDSTRLEKVGGGGSGR